MNDWGLYEEREITSGLSRLAALKNVAFYVFSVPSLVGLSRTSNALDGAGRESGRLVHNRAFPFP